MIPLERRRHFLAVVSKEEAEKRWRDALRPEPLGVEEVPLDAALGRVLGADVTAKIDLPPFDRAVVDGFAVLASDTVGANDEQRVRLELAAAAVAAGETARGVEVTKGKAVEVATGAPVPRGANAVVMVEDCEREPGAVLVGRALVPGDGIQLAGSDVRAGETLFRKGERLGARETGVLAGLGVGSVPCFVRPRVAVVSTGDELVPPGEGPLAFGQIYDSNARIVCDMVRENGCEAFYLGIARDRREDLLEHFERARAFDALVLSGGTSKGAGDLTYRLVNELGKPGILVHGVAVKPGKPIVLAAWDRKPVVILPGFPSSAAITFDVFVKPVLRTLAGLAAVEPRDQREARLAVTTPAGGGRHELVLCHLVKGEGDELVAFPILKGSGSVSAFAQADGFFEIAANKERAERGERVRVTVLNASRAAPDLVVMGSACPALDALLGLLREKTGITSKLLGVGATAGMDAVARGEADLAPVNLLDESGIYNELQARARGVGLVRGYERAQGLVARDLAPLGSPPRIARARALGWRLVNRNMGSGTRVLIDGLVAEAARESGAEDARGWASGWPGFDAIARSAQGAVAAVAGSRADLTVALESVAREAKLDFFLLRDEALDFAVSRERLGKPAVRAFVELLKTPEARALVDARRGFAAADDMGDVS